MRVPKLQAPPCKPAVHYFAGSRLASLGYYPPLLRDHYITPSLPAAVWRQPPFVGLS